MFTLSQITTKSVSELWNDTKLVTKAVAMETVTIGAAGVVIGSKATSNAAQVVAKKANNVSTNVLSFLNKKYGQGGE
jgi:hypothetical protein